MHLARKFYYYGKTLERTMKLTLFEQYLLAQYRASSPARRFIIRALLRFRGRRVLLWLLAFKSNPHKRFEVGFPETGD